MSVSSTKENARLSLGLRIDWRAHDLAQQVEWLKSDAARAVEACEPDTHDELLMIAVHVSDAVKALRNLESKRSDP